MPKPPRHVVDLAIVGDTPADLLAALAVATERVTRGDYGPLHTIKDRYELELEIGVLSTPYHSKPSERPDLYALPDPHPAA